MLKQTFLTVLFLSYFNLFFVSTAIGLTIETKESKAISMRVLLPDNGNSCPTGAAGAPKNPISKNQFVYDVTTIWPNRGINTDHLNYYTYYEEYGAQICITFGIFAGVQYWYTLRADNSTDCKITIHNIKDGYYTTEGTCKIY